MSTQEKIPSPMGGRSPASRKRLPALLSIILALALLAGITLSACAPRGETEEPVIDDQPVIIEEPEDPGPPPTPLPELAAIARDYHERNEDTVGWLYVPNAPSLDWFVLWYPHDTNNFYLRRNFEREYDFNGVYFADFRTQWGDFTRENLSRNIVIYGHSMDDDPDSTLFSQFKRWWDEDWARNNPHVFFSTLEEDMAWEIFSVHFSNIWVPYNTPDPDDEAFAALIEDAKARSLWIYDDIEVTIEDTIITFSTCIYGIPPEASPTGERIPLSYPNDYRFVVMARLVERDAFLEETVSITVNPDVASARLRANATREEA
ncbi:MAG: class B sortase [Oscillospiraceae bacterium]|nr:class B sortase [Oscillospiraceae bacterium]